MAQYSSGKHAKRTDPFPWRTPIGTRGRRALAGYTLTYDPRPEFDRPLTNPPNKFLIGARDARGKIGHPDWITVVLDGWDYVEDIYIRAGYLDELIHARKVLYRLLAVYDDPV